MICFVRSLGSSPSLKVRESVPSTATRKPCLRCWSHPTRVPYRRFMVIPSALCGVSAGAEGADRRHRGRGTDLSPRARGQRHPNQRLRPPGASRTFSLSREWLGFVVQESGFSFVSFSFLMPRLGRPRWRVPGRCSCRGCVPRGGVPRPTAIPGERRGRTADVTGHALI